MAWSKKGNILLRKEAENKVEASLPGKFMKDV
jgi:hypothetical protein